MGTVSVTCRLLHHAEDRRRRPRRPPDMKGANGRSASDQRHHRGAQPAAQQQVDLRSPLPSLPGARSSILSAQARHRRW
ncbi:MAG: hypothetical protein KIS63_05215 [Caldilineales bacterium]|nr:hypothetical protein [Caldilineales bacterium]